MGATSSTDRRFPDIVSNIVRYTNPNNVNNYVEFVGIDLGLPTNIQKENCLYNKLLTLRRQRTFAYTTCEWQLP